MGATFAGSSLIADGARHEPTRRPAPLQRGGVAAPPAPANPSAATAGTLSLEKPMASIEKLRNVNDFHRKFMNTDAQTELKAANADTPTRFSIKRPHEPPIRYADRIVPTASPEGPPCQAGERPHTMAFYIWAPSGSLCRGASYEGAPYRGVSDLM